MARYESSVSNEKKKAPKKIALMLTGAIAASSVLGFASCNNDDPNKSGDSPTPSTVEQPEYPTQDSTVTDNPTEDALHDTSNQTGSQYTYEGFEDHADKPGQAELQAALRETGLDWSFDVSVAGYLYYTAEVDGYHLSICISGKKKKGDLMVFLTAKKPKKKKSSSVGGRLVTLSNHIEHLTHETD
jgi:hypothetical protein